MSVVPAEVEIKVADPEHLKDVLHFLQNSFYKDEPLVASLKQTEGEVNLTEDQKRRCKKYLESGSSLLAFHAGRLIGVCLNYIEEKQKSLQNEPLSKIREFLRFTDTECDAFAKYPDCEKCIETVILSVDASYRGKGIAKMLIEKTREIGKEKSCGFMKVACTSNFSARAVSSLGFELIYSLKYEDYKKDGKVVFKPAAPHTALTIYTKKIE